jgi:hypothetical protein
VRVEAQRGAKGSVPSFTPIQSGLLQRKCACGGSPGADGECAECQKKPLDLRKKGDSGRSASSVPSIVHQTLGSPGRSLDAGTRTLMESRLGHDFSRVRIHDDAPAAESARAVGALAYTVGSDVTFAAGRFSPGSIAGRRLLAHELTHVAQQASGRAGNLQRDAGEDAGADPLEAEAEEAEDLLADEAEEESDDELEDLSGPIALADGKGKGKTAGKGKGKGKAKGKGKGKAAKAGPSFSAKMTSPTGCVPTTGTGSTRTSSSAITIDWERDNKDDGEITLRQLEDSDKILHTISIPAGTLKGTASIPSGIPVANENHHYQLEMTFKGGKLGGFKRRPAIKFQICSLKTAPTGTDLLFTKTLFAEGVDAGEFARVRDLVFNRIDWVKTCATDEASFGKPDVNSVLNAPKQFDSVLKGNSNPKFKQFGDEVAAAAKDACRYTTPPRPGQPGLCALINDAIDAFNAGDQNTNSFIFFRSDTKTPSSRAVNRSQYPGGNFYWEISGC